MRIRITPILVYFMELILSITVLILVFFGKVDNNLSIAIIDTYIYLPFSIYMFIIGIWVLLLCIQKKVNSYEIIAIAFALFILFFLYIMFLYFFELSNIMRIFIIPIILIIFVSTNNKEFIKINEKKYRVLRKGEYNDKITIITLILWIIIIGMIMCSKLYYNRINIPLIISFYIIPIIVMSFIKIIFNPLMQAVFILNKQLSHKGFIEKMDKIKKNSLHPETINYLNLICFYYSYNTDIDAAIKSFNISKKPGASVYSYFYEYIHVLYLCNTNNIDEAKRLLSEYNLKRNDKIKLEL